MSKILVVDSSVQNTDLLTQLFSSHGYETMSSESGHNALAKVAAYKPDLIILDVYLTDMSGFDVCKKIKNTPESKYIMVLCTSSGTTRETTKHAIQAGADDFMEKTFDPALLLIKVKSLLRVKHLSDQLKSNFAELEEKNKILEMQLKMAQQVQSSLLPDISLNLNGIHIFSKYMPALDIGGDFYDVFNLKNNCVGIIMGDVSGHGISAALLTAMMHSMVRSLSYQFSSPDLLLSAMNTEFCKIFENSSIGMYSCIFYIMIDTRQGKIYYSNAGQTLPFYVDSITNSVSELDSTGVPIGLMSDSSYETKELSYNKGDLILLHTDGLADTFYKESPDEFLSLIKKTLLDVYTLEDGREIIDILLSEFYNFSATDAQKLELDDVSTILCKM